MKHHSKLIKRYKIYYSLLTNDCSQKLAILRRQWDNGLTRFLIVNSDKTLGLFEVKLICTQGVRTAIRINLSAPL